MPVAITPFQRRTERQEAPKESAIDSLLKGLQIAGSAMGLYTNLQQAQAYKQQQETGKFELGEKQAASKSATKESDMMKEGRITQDRYVKMIEAGKVTPVYPKLGQELDPSVLKLTVETAQGDRPVFLRQMKPYEGEAERAAALTKQQSDQAFRKGLQEAAQKNTEKLATLKKAVEKTKEPSTAELAKVQQAESMIVTNEGLEKSLERFDPTSRLYMGQMKLPVGAKAAEWQQYETSARQFIDPLARVRTGAAMPESEFASYMQQFFPMPGDTQEMVQQKAILRQKGIDEVMSMGRRARTDGGAPTPAKPKLVPGNKLAKDLPSL